MGELRLNLCISILEFKSNFMARLQNVFGTFMYFYIRI